MGIVVLRHHLYSFLTNSPDILRIWQVSPPPVHPGLVNFNLPTYPGLAEQLAATKMERAPIISKVVDLTLNMDIVAVAQNPADHEAYHETFVDRDKTESGEFSAYGIPHSVIIEPIFKDLYDETSEIVGFVSGIIPWDRYLTNLLPEGVRGITCVLENTCGQAFTYELDGKRVRRLEMGVIRLL